MKKQLIALMITSTMAVSNVSYAQTSQVNQASPSQEEEAIGLGSGLVIGAIVGGPIGAFVGAVTGGFIGKSVSNDEFIEQQQVRIDKQQGEMELLAKKNQSLNKLAEQYASTQRQLNELKGAQQSRLSEMALGLNVQFRTGSAQVEPHFQNQLDKVAILMSLSPELTLDLAGYADRRGESDFNLALSNQRVIEVKNYLVSQGVEAARLTGVALGDTAPLMAEQSRENDFFDRRVMLKLISPQTATASN